MPRRHAPRGAKLNQRQKRQVKRLIGNRVEDKILDSSAAAASVDAGGTIGLIGLPAQGTGPYQRVGEEITLKKLQFTFTWAGADTTNLVRLILFRWGDNNATSTPLFNDVVTSAGPLPFHNDTNTESGRVKILYDKLIALSSNGNDSYVRKASVYGTKLGKKRLVFNPTLITARDAIYYYVVTDSVAASHPTFAMTARLHYTDA